MIGTLGVIVAGGRGERLGLGRPKALVPVAGVTLLERTIAILEPLCDDWVVAAPASMALPVPADHRVCDVPEAEGPLSGLVAGLAGRAYGRALALGVDFPLIGRDVLARLLERLGTHAAAVPRPGGVPQPLVAAYGPGAAGALKHRLEAGERSLRAALAVLDPVWLDDPALLDIEGGLGNFFNLNTRDQLAEVEERLALAGRRKPCA